MMLELMLTGQYLAKAKHTPDYDEFLSQAMQCSTSNLTILPPDPTYIRPTILLGYAMLSIRAGFLAGAADTFIKRTHFVPQVHHHVRMWTLTLGRLLAWKAEAVAMGISADMLEPTVSELHVIISIIPSRIAT